MSDKTGIEWTDATWNPTTGCDRVSPGCDNCYALTLAKRLKAMGSPRYQLDGNPATSGPGFAFAEHPDALDQPLRWTRPRRIFVNSMSDLFHSDMSDEFLAQVFAVMALAGQHTFQVLTKRPGRMRSLLNSDAFQDLFGEALYTLEHPLGEETAEPISQWPLPNVWLGTSVEDQKRADLRIPQLLGTPAAVRFLSMEPLLGPVVLNGPELVGLDWVIAGGESGPGARPMHPQWARSLRNDCQATGVAFHFKQWGEWRPWATHVGPMFTRFASDVLADPEALEAFNREGQQTHRFDDGALVERVGKKKAGRELDGRTWDQFPQAVTS